MRPKPRSSLPKRALGGLPPARRAAYLSLERLQAQSGEGPPLQAILDAVLKSSRLKPEDAALASNLAYGVTRWRIRLDRLLGLWLKRLGDLPPALRDILRLAAYEIVFLEHIPAYASVNWAVEAAKNAYGPRLGGTANAVLRKLAGSGGRPLQEEFYREPGQDRRAFLSIWHSQPPWLIEHFLGAYPEEEALAYLRAFVSEPVVGLRVNRLKPDWERLRDRLAGLPGCLETSGPALLFKAGQKPAGVEELIRAGKVSRQSYAAQVILTDLLRQTAALEAGFTETISRGVWDACCGRGNKTCQLLESGLPVQLASDVNLSRIQGLRSDLSRLGLSGQAPVSALADAAAACPLRDCPPVILADVPCSGLGTLNHRPDIKYRRTPSDLQDLATLQGRILDNLLGCLPSGGFLLYLTCTLNPAENQNLLADIISARPGLELALSLQSPSQSLANEFFFAATLKKPAGRARTANK